MQRRWGRLNDQHLAYTLVFAWCALQAAAVAQEQLAALIHFSPECRLLRDLLRSLRTRAGIAGFLCATLSLLAVGALTGEAHMGYLFDRAAELMRVHTPFTAGQRNPAML